MKPLTKLEIYQEAIKNLENTKSRNREEERVILLQIQELNINYSKALSIL